MELAFSFIIPVYNRPNEVRELFESMRLLEGKIPFEVVLVEDGSTEDASEVVAEFSDSLPVKYLVKENTGPGHSRNYGMQQANGNYFIILDSDCMLPPGYLMAVSTSLEEDYVDCFGGPDQAHRSFSPIQKAVNYAMTSVLTTGGIRGGRQAIKGFEPRSFNMGISVSAFRDSGGFGDIHPGEDPDLSIRLKTKGYTIKLIPDAFVYHKRRISFRAFYRQVRKFGKVRPILNKWHPHSARIVYWFPSLFILGLILAVVLPLFDPAPLWFYPIAFYFGYFLILLADSWMRTAGLKVALLAVLAVLLQFTAYGLGFLESTILVKFSGKNPRELFPELFFK
jgi:glycosyltransferase involved in cell wall biosynthesis